MQRTDWGAWRRIACFFYQNGFSLEASANFAAGIVGTVKTEMQEEEPEEQKKLLYRLALKQLSGSRPAPPAEEQAIKFEEDREVHQAILGLKPEHRSLLLLREFHGFSAAEAAALLETDAVSAEEAAEEGMDLLRGMLHLETREQVVKRLEFLGASYNRVQFPAFPETESAAAGEPEQAAEKTAQRKDMPVKKGAAATILAVSLFLLTVIGVSFAMSDPLPQHSAASGTDNMKVLDRATVNRWEAEYQEVRLRAPEEMGIPEEVFDELEYVKKADSLLEEAFSRKTLKRFREEPEEVEQRYQKALLTLQTPAGMIRTFRDIPMDENETTEAVYLFAEKTEELMTVSDNLFRRYADELEGAVYNGSLSAELLMARRENAPGEVARLLDGLSEQMLTVTVHPNESRFTVRRNMVQLYEYASVILSPEVHQYLFFLENDPYFDETGFLLPEDHLAFLLSDMERFLVTAEPGGKLYSEVETVYRELFWLIMKGSEAEPVTGRDGRIRPEVREMWNSLLSTASANPIVYVLLPIIDEMEASGWLQSEQYDKLTKEEIMLAVKLEQSGELKNRLPGSGLAAESQLVMVDSEKAITERMDGLYKRFAAAHDPVILAGVDAMDIYLLSEYAKIKEDPVTLWHLYAEDPLKPGLEDYVESWRKTEAVTAYADWVEINSENIYRQGRNLYLEPMIGFTENINQRNPVLVSADDSTWKLKYQLFESYSLTDPASELLLRVDSLYREFKENRDPGMLAKATPGEIGALFLHAGDQGDHKTMAALLDSTPEVQRFSRAADSPEYRLSSYTHLVFHSDSYMFPEGPPSGWLQADRNTGNGEQQMSQAFSMVKKAEGWRIQFPD